MSYFIYGPVALKEATNLFVHLLLLGLAPAGWFAKSLCILSTVAGRLARADDRTSSRSSRLRVRSLTSKSEVREHWVGYLIPILVWIYWMMYLLS